MSTTATGYGLQTPFRRDRRDFAASDGDPHVVAKIGQVLSTPLGSLAWRTDFGSNLHRLLHADPDVDITAIARSYTADALSRWIPALRIREFSAQMVKSSDGERNKLRVSLTYDIAPEQGRVAVTTGQTVTVEI